MRYKSTPAGAALVYDVSDFFAVSFIGVESGSNGYVQFMPHAPVSPMPPIKDPCFSSAPLSDVVSVEVFRDQTGFCQGILLTYGNGGRRALGQCRLGVDRSIICKNPLRICAANFKFQPPKRGYQLEVAKVEAGQDVKHSHRPLGYPWKCFPMKGLLEFRYQCDQLQLYHIEGN